MFPMYPVIFHSVYISMVTVPSVLLFSIYLDGSYISYVSLLHVTLILSHDPKIIESFTHSIILIHLVFQNMVLFHCQYFEG